MTVKADPTVGTGGWSATFSPAAPSLAIFPGSTWRGCAMNIGAKTAASLSPGARVCRPVIRSTLRWQIPEIERPCLPPGHRQHTIMPA
jgi:hypothetical protein